MEVMNQVSGTCWNGVVYWNDSEYKCKGVTCCLGVRPDLGFGFGVGVLESGVGWDRASASGSLRQLDFHVRYLAIGRGHIITHHNSKHSTFQRAHNLLP